MACQSSCNEAISSESCELTFGGEYPRLDKAERWIHYPSEKFKHWFTKEEVAVDPKEMRRLAVNKAQEYLVLNGLTDINIDIRQYDPATQWDDFAITTVFIHSGNIQAAPCRICPTPCSQDAYFVSIDLIPIQNTITEFNRPIDGVVCGCRGKDHLQSSLSRHVFGSLRHPFRWDIQKHTCRQ